MAKRQVDKDHLGNSYSPDLQGRRSRAVFSVDANWRRGREPLPRVDITESTAESAKIENSTAVYTTPRGGRFHIMYFPDEAPPPHDETALYFANGYYYDAYYMSCDPQHLGKRIDYFRMAEILYLHAALRGNDRAHVGLGNIYYYDRCEGHYFDAVRDDLYSDAVLDPQIIAQKAHDHFRLAAEAGDLEGCFMYGDVLREGVGCEVDYARALDMYYLALERCRDMQGMMVTAPGCIHARLGRAHEEGEGCPRDLDTALEHYEAALEYLERAAERFALRFDPELALSRRGIARIRQEMALANA
ncbi:MAG: sel1 repeat family protein [Eggerthellaceae bacterium]|nr:sel1 repeat family protein [Eggerthellaceae bacterium]